MRNAKEFMPKNLSNGIMVECQCSSEALQINYDQEYSQYELSMWFQGFKSPMTWRQRARFIWRILTTGDPWVDYMLIDKLDAQKIVDYINLTKSE